MYWESISSLPLYVSLSLSLSLGLSLTTNTTPTYNTITGKVLEKYNKLWGRGITGLLNIFPLPVIIFKVSYNQQEFWGFFLINENILK